MWKNALQVWASRARSRGSRDLKTKRWISSRCNEGCIWQSLMKNVQLLRWKVGLYILGWVITTKCCNAPPIVDLADCTGNYTRASNVKRASWVPEWISSCLLRLTYRAQAVLRLPAEKLLHHVWEIVRTKFLPKARVQHRLTLERVVCEGNQCWHVPRDPGLLHALSNHAYDPNRNEVGKYIGTERCSTMISETVSALLGYRSSRLDYVALWSTSSFRLLHGPHHARHFSIIHEANLSTLATRTF